MFTCVAEFAEGDGSVVMFGGNNTDSYQAGYLITKAKPSKCPGKKKGCVLPKYKKDKNCDDENNNCRCAWDGGDCCPKTNSGSINKKYCKVCKCLDPENQSDPNCKGGCGAAKYKGDGNCDDENNNCGCQ